MPAAPPIVLIAAMSADRVIGAGDGMPWDVPEEYQQFRDLTRDQTIVMGRKSYEIFGPDLTSRHTLVVTHREQVDGPGVACSSLESALEQAAALACTVFVAGGAAIYQQALPRAAEMMLSTIHGEFSGDAYFPEFDPAEWRIVDRCVERRFTFTHYRRREL